MESFPSSWASALRPANLLIFALAHVAAASAAAEDHLCATASYSEARSLAQLPQPVRALLKTDSHGLAELTDRGGSFNAGDVGGGPRRRFILAAVGTERIYVAIEHGGIGYSVELWSLESGKDGWQGKQTSSVFDPPHSLKELISLVCNSST